MARHPLLRSLFVVWTTGAFLVAPLTAALLPVYAKERLGGRGTWRSASPRRAPAAYGVAGRRLPRRAFFAGMWTL